MEMIEGKTFTNVTIELDGRGYVNCSFIGCHLIFRGREPFGLGSPVLKNTTMEFADAAALTIQAIGLFYRAGGALRQWVDHEVHSGFAPKPNVN